MSGCKYADDFVGLLETLEGLQKQAEKALIIEYATLGNGG